MKTRILLMTLVACLFLFTQCKKNKPEPKPTTLNGIWHMKSVYGGLMGVNLNYNVGEVSWTFNKASGNVMVENNILTNGPKSIYARFATGTYTFKDSLVNNQSTLFVDGMEIGLMSITSTTLTLDDGIAADGFVTTFNR